ncbi:MAG: pyridoxamine 5'-phosphate oxidase family protein [Oscillospiraceae bacterium]|nr:pyridoxamine 5'-phosphate oxidase family protein [Oscillospiraceae bacterium]
MRRSDREITDAAQIAAFLEQEQIIRIAFYDHGEIYIVPVNYGVCCENGSCRFYFHGAAAGRKYTLSLLNPSVGFEIDGNYALLSAEDACGHSAAYQSVTGTGRVSIVTDEAERMAGLRCLMRQATGKEEWTFRAEAADKTAVFRLDAETLSCKAKQVKKFE